MNFYKIKKEQASSLYEDIRMVLKDQKDKRVLQSKVYMDNIIDNKGGHLLEMRLEVEKIKENNYKSYKYTSCVKHYKRCIEFIKGNVDLVVNSEKILREICGLLREILIEGGSFCSRDAIVLC